MKNRRGNVLPRYVKSAVKKSKPKSFANKRIKNIWKMIDWPKNSADVCFCDVSEWKDSRDFCIGNVKYTSVANCYERHCIKRPISTHGGISIARSGENACAKLMNCTHVF